MRISWTIIAFIAIFAAWLAGMFVDILEVDAAQYGSMSQGMAASGDFLHLFDLGEPYLDKPPLIFWGTALSYKLFGVSNFSYKLPSVLFALLALYSTFQFTLLYYARRTAWVATLILACCQCFFTMNLDVKTDMYLTGAVIFAIWQLCLHIETKKWLPLVLGFAGLGLGMLAKGPIALVIPAFAIGADRALRRDWKAIFNWKWLVGIPVFGLVVLPFCIGLYQQFGGEGLQFFFWTQSFGRVTGDSDWVNDAGAFFLVETFAWAFLPWTILWIPALIKSIQEVVTSRFRLGMNPEAVALGGFLLTLIALSSSRFKLPHYIFVVAPFAAIMVAGWATRITQEATRSSPAKIWGRIQFAVALLLLVATAGLVTWAFAGIHIAIALYGLVSAVAVFFSYQSLRASLYRLIIPSVLAISATNFVMNTHIYPRLLTYQVSGKVGRQIAAGKYPADATYNFLAFGRATNHYAGTLIPTFSNFDQLKAKLREKGEIYVYTRQLGMDEIQNGNLNYEVMDTLGSFHVAKLNIKFLNPSTRKVALRPRYMVRINQEK